MAVADLDSQQKEMVRQLLEMMLRPFRACDAAEVRECLDVAGGADKLRLTYFKEGDIGDDGVWDIWKLEGPAFSWYFRGSPHVHTWLTWQGERESLARRGPASSHRLAGGSRCGGTSIRPSRLAPEPAIPSANRKRGRSLRCAGGESADRATTLRSGVSRCTGMALGGGQSRGRLKSKCAVPLGPWRSSRPGTSPRCSCNPQGHHRLAPGTWAESSRTRGRWGSMCRLLSMPPG